MRRAQWWNLAPGARLNGPTDARISNLDGYPVPPFIRDHDGAAVRVEHHRHRGRISRDDEPRHADDGNGTLLIPASQARRQDAGQILLHRDVHGGCR